VVELSFEIVEGPDAAVEVPLSDSRIEPQHTRVTASADGALVEDLGDPGGTFVNDAELRVPTWIKPGDELQVGVTVLKLRAGEAPREVRAKPASWQARRRPRHSSHPACRSECAGRRRSTSCSTCARSGWRATRRSRCS
jgi:pSer/pThr/pTyr-binding forkhead associated (FHA) protein